VKSEKSEILQGFSIEGLESNEFATKHGRIKVEKGKKISLEICKGKWLLEISENGEKVRVTR